MRGIRLIRFSRERSEADKRVLQRIHAEAADYCMRVIGHIPRLREMRPAEPPSGREPEPDYFFGINLQNEMIGCADLLRGYPDEKSAYLGLVLIWSEPKVGARGARVHGTRESGSFVARDLRYSGFRARDQLHCRELVEKIWAPPTPGFGGPTRQATWIAKRSSSRRNSSANNFAILQ